MAKRIFALGALTVFSMLGAAASRAELPPVEVDGCAHLARVVYQEVSAAAIYGPENAGPWLIGSSPDEIQSCKTVARTVSRAFTSAMLSAGIRVRWINGTVEPGDICDGGFLSQCYPDRGLPGGGFGSDDSMVMSSWAVVSQIVMREMYNPFSSDEIHFKGANLKLRLGLSLRTVRIPVGDDLSRQREVGIRHNDADIAHRR